MVSEVTHIGDKKYMQTTYIEGMTDDGNQFNLFVFFLIREENVSLVMRIAQMMGLFFL